MDDRHFDVFIRTIGRRGLLGATLGILGATSLQDASAQVPSCVLKSAGEKCWQGSECCSGRCKRKKKKNKGHCRCGALLTPCEDNVDCCAGATTPEPGGISCGFKSGFAETVCCVSFGGPCQNSVDCCGILVCKEGICLEA